MMKDGVHPRLSKAPLCVGVYVCVISISGTFSALMTFHLTQIEQKKLDFR